MSKSFRILWSNPDSKARHAVKLILLDAAILSGEVATAHHILELGTSPTLSAYNLYCSRPWGAKSLISIMKAAAESGVDMHGLIHGWSLMDVVNARGCPRLASFLAGN